MSQLCLYFQLHQPWRLRRYSLFEVGNQHDYFNTPNELDFANQRVMAKVAAKSYWPMFRLLRYLLDRYPNFRFALSFSGVALEQIQQFVPDLLLLIQDIVATGRVEILAETYYHSLAALYSPAEFYRQVAYHGRLVNRLFGVRPLVFRNTELVVSNDIAHLVEAMGYLGMLAEGADRILGDRAPTALYASPAAPRLPLLLKHYRLSDDIAFRFSQRSWAAWPLTAETYAHWLTAPFGANDLLNLFMDFETFGEHQWEDTGIFPFFEKVVALLAENNWAQFVTPTQAVTTHQIKEVYDASTPVSWADVDRDLTAWVGNPLQHDVLRLIYELEESVLAQRNPGLTEDWRRLQTSDHFYYMCTKWANDGDVHAYFSPYGSPYEAYVNYNNVLADFRGRI